MVHIVGRMDAHAGRAGFAGGSLSSRGRDTVRYRERRSLAPLQPTPRAKTNTGKNLVFLTQIYFQDCRNEFEGIDFRFNTLKPKVSHYIGHSSFFRFKI